MQEPLSSSSVLLWLDPNSVLLISILIRIGLCTCVHAEVHRIAMGTSPMGTSYSLGTIHSLCILLKFIVTSNTKIPRTKNLWKTQEKPSPVPETTQRRQGRQHTKHPNDVKQLKQHKVYAKKGKRRSKPIPPKFDSTLGYPGEGPPRGGKAGRGRGVADRQSRCALCGRLGHRDEDCRTPKCTACDRYGHVAARCRTAINGPAAVAAAAMNLAPTAGAIVAALELADGKLDDGDDQRLVEVEVKVEQGPPEQSDEEKREAKRIRILADLSDKAGTMLLTKDLSNPDDHNVVIRAMVAIARKTDLFDYMGDTTPIIQEIFDRQLRSVMSIKTISSHNRAIDTRNLSFAERIYKTLSGNVYEGDSNYKTPATNLAHNAKIEIHSRLDVSKWPWLKWIALRATMLATKACWPVLEELFKKVVISRLRQSFVIASLEKLGLHKHLANLLVYAIPSLLISVHESADLINTGHCGLGMFSIISRLAAHTVLASCTTKASICYHLGWNLAFYNLRKAWMLDISRFSDLTSNSKVLSDVCCADHKILPAATQGGFKVRYGEQICNPKFGVRMSFGVKDIVPTVYRSCSHNEEISLCGRVGKLLPAHQSKERTLEIVKNWQNLTNVVLPVFKNLIRSVRQPMNFKEWVSSFPPHKRAALSAIRAEGTYEYSKEASSFIKKEIALKDASDVLLKDPRFIQGCNPALSVEVGPCTRKFSKNLRQGLRSRSFIPHDVRKGRQITYVCGLDADMVGDEFAKALTVIEEMCDLGEKVVIIEDDQSRFDLHLLKGPFTFLDKLYRAKLPRKVACLLKRGKSKGKSNLGTKYSVPYTMQSGWPDTSCGDTATNAAMKHSIHVTGRKWMSIINGDDSVTVTTDRELELLGGPCAIIKRYADLGMEVELSVVTDPLEVGFCSGRFMPVGESYTLVPKVGRLLAKLGWDMTNRNADGQKAWLRGICETLLSYGQLDPLLHALGNNIKGQLGFGKTIAQPLNQYKSLPGKRCYVWPDLLTYYDAHYAMSASDISKCVDYLSNLKVGEMITHPLIANMAILDV